MAQLTQPHDADPPMQHTFTPDDEPDSARESIPPVLSPHLQRTQSDPRPVVLMTCGLAGMCSMHTVLNTDHLTDAGAGKTTLVKAIIQHHPQFTRVSIDNIIFQAHGIYGVDYAASSTLYEQYNDEADVIYLDTFRRLLAEGKDVAFERSCYSKEDRDEWRKIAEEGGARVVLVFLRAQDKEILWDRICKRSERDKTAENALDISRETFEMYWEGFENPEGEGEIVIDVV